MQGVDLPRGLCAVLLEKNPGEVRKSSGSNFAQVHMAGFGATPVLLISKSNAPINLNSVNNNDISSIFRQVG